LEKVRFGAECRFFVEKVKCAEPWDEDLPPN